jgi:hypothetical protein
MAEGWMSNIRSLIWTTRVFNVNILNEGFHDILRPI